MIRAKFLNQIRNKIKRAVENSGKSQKQIAKETGIDRSNFNRYLNGTNCLSDKNLTKLMNHFNLL